MLRDMKAYDCECDKCGHVWFSATVPVRCAKCKSRAWNGGADQAGAVVQVPKVQESRRQVVAPKKTEPAPQVATAKTECAWCGGKLITWGSGQRCETCKRNQ